jgi:hypothetical protein
MIDTKLHCPDCATGYLRKLSDEELLTMFPMSRASQCIRHPEELKTQYGISPKGNMYEILAKPNRVGMYCDKCGHFHDMDERSLKWANDKRNTGKPKSLKIKGYGNYRR